MNLKKQLKNGRKDFKVFDTDTNSGADFEGQDLANIEAQYCDFSYASFRDCCLFSANFQGSIFDQTDFSGADLRGVNFVNCEFRSCFFNDVRLDDNTDFGHLNIRPHVLHGLEPYDPENE